MYETTVPANSWLINQKHKSSVNLYYLRCDAVSEDGAVQEIEAYEISEAQPEQRLRKLLIRGNLEEAEQCARQYNLCLQPIYKEQANRLWLDIRTTKMSVSTRDLSNFFKIFIIKIRRFRPTI